MMFSVKKIKKLLTTACVYFTAAEFVLLAITSAVMSASPQSGGGLTVFLNLGSASLIFLACVIMSAMNGVFSLELSGVLRVLIHFLGSLAAYTLVFVMIPGAWKDFGALFARLGVFLILYFVIAIIVLVVNSVKQSRRSDDSEYESQFGEFFKEKNKK